MPWAEIHDDMLQKQMGLLWKWQEWSIKGTQYPLSEVEKWYEFALRELFAESVSAYTMGKMDILDEDMKQLLDFIFLK
jgi:hypothetical protein